MNLLRNCDQINSNNFIIQSIFSKLLTYSLKSLNEFEKHLLSCAHYPNKYYCNTFICNINVLKCMKLFVPLINKE